MDIIVAVITILFGYWFLITIFMWLFETHEHNLLIVQNPAHRPTLFGIIKAQYRLIGSCCGFFKTLRIR